MVAKCDHGKLTFIPSFDVNEIAVKPDDPYSDVTR